VLSKMFKLVEDDVNENLVFFDCRSEYDDWRLQIASLIQPIPFPDE